MQLISYLQKFFFFQTSTFTGPQKRMSDNMAEAQTLAEVVLQHVDKKGHINSLELATELKEDHQKIVGAIKSLQSFGEVIPLFETNT